MVLFYFGSFPCLLSDYFLGICCGQAFAWNVLQIIPSSPFPPGAHCVLWEKRLLYFIKFTHFWSKMLGQFRRWNNIWWKLTELIFVKGFWSMILSILQHWYPSCLCLLETKADYVVHLSRGFPLKKPDSSPSKNISSIIRVLNMLYKWGTLRSILFQGVFSVCDLICTASLCSSRCYDFYFSNIIRLKERLMTYL